MAVNLINNEQIHVNQDGSNITLDIQGEALKNKNAVVGSIRSKNTLQNGASANINSYGITVKTNDDGSVSLTGTQTSATVYFTDVKKILAKDIQNGNYTLSFSNSSYSNIAYRIRKYNGSNKTIIVNETLLSSDNYSYTFNLKGLIDNDTTQVEIDIICYGTNAKNVSLSPQLELGNTATTYSPYQNLNGYDNYSTGEVMIGTWIDGKPLYRKVIETGRISSTTKNVAHGISNLDRVIKLEGIGGASGFFATLPRVSQSQLIYQCGLQLTGNNIVIQAGSDCSFDDSFVIVEYTKTTD